MSNTAWRQTRPPSLHHIDTENLKRKPTNRYSRQNNEIIEDTTPNSDDDADKCPIIKLNNEAPVESATTAVVPEMPAGSPMKKDSAKRLSTAGNIPVDIINLLHTLPFFSGLDQSEEFIAKISKVLSLRKYQTGDVIINQGETAKAMFFIIKGTLTVMSDDGEIEVAELSSGSYFGEIGILFEVQRTASVVAKSPCTLLTLTSEKVSQELDAYPEIRKNVLSIAQARLLSLAKQFEKSGKKVSNDITRQIADFGIAAEISVPSIDQSRTHYLDDLKVPESPSSAMEVDDDTYDDPEDIIAPIERKDLSKPITSANILSKKLTEKRRASVAVWSDAKLMAFASNVASQVPAKESRFAASSAYLSSASSPTASSANLTAFTNAKAAFYTLDRSLISRILSFLDLDSLNNSRGISKYFHSIVTEKESNHYTLMNLTPYCKKINDEKLLRLLQFTGSLVMKLTLKNCWSVTDIGLNYISLNCPTIVHLDLSSCWDITDAGLLRLAEVSEHLESLNLSNCRKITDFGLMSILKKSPGILQIQLSYCKNLTGKMMDLEVWRSIREVNFQRATSIRDDGFLNWAKLSSPESNIYFALEDLNLSDCSFLTDATIQVLGSKCPQLKRLCLSFCCSLTEKFAEYLSNGCPFIQVLDTSYCGAAVTDTAVKILAQGLPRLNSLGLRGCVLLTDQGIEYLATNALALHTLNFTQCKNVSPTICKRLGIEWNCIATPVYIQNE